MSGTTASTAQPGDSTLRWSDSTTPAEAVQLGLEYGRSEAAAAAADDDELRYLRFSERICYDWASDFVRQAEWSKAIWAITAARTIRDGRLAYWERRAAEEVTSPVSSAEKSFGTGEESDNGHATLTP